MALEEKREIDEILIRCNSKTNGGNDGVAITYRTWIEKDGDEMEGTSKLEGPTTADWGSDEVTSRLGEAIPSLQAQLDAANARIAELENTKPADLGSKSTE